MSHQPLSPAGGVADDDTPEPRFLHASAATYKEPFSTPHTVSVLLFALVLIVAAFS